MMKHGCWRNGYVFISYYLPKNLPRNIADAIIPAYLPVESLKKHVLMLCSAYLQTKHRFEEAGIQP